MKKHFLTILALTISICSYAQKNKEYRASNGVTYNVGDTIQLGRGSATNGDFLYLQMGGWAGAIAGGGSDSRNIGKRYANTNVIIKKIKSAKVRGSEKHVFTVAGGNITNYELLIDEAIESGEIKDIHKKSADTNVVDDDLTKLEKLKKLLDSGAITQEEFDAKKKQILGL
ncbi:SHOCT domain-containing protein [Pedobacter antarcticus]|uniref:SHOCT domain-containing protein n=1 Tax=Pedobacter antarcticus TaxID=34086 RepID=UPI00292E5CC5|nr:SHOCT domain-containing protein [Pedobacter antarcticus]